MDQPIRKLTPEEIREQYRKATQRWDGESTFHHFATDEQRAAHQQYVLALQAKHEIQF